MLWNNGRALVASGPRWKKPARCRACCHARQRTSGRSHAQRQEASPSASEDANGYTPANTQFLGMPACRSPSLICREPAPEAVCLAIACACSVAASCHRRLAFGFWKRRRRRGRKRAATAASQCWSSTGPEQPGERFRKLASSAQGPSLRGNCARILSRAAGFRLLEANMQTGTQEAGGASERSRHRQYPDGAPDHSPQGQQHLHRGDRR